MNSRSSHNRWVLIAVTAVLIGIGPAIDIFPLSGSAGVTASQGDTARRALPQDVYELPDSFPTTIVSTVIEIESHFDRDGRSFLRLDSGEKTPFEIVLGSLHTRPPPT